MMKIDELYEWTIKEEYSDVSIKIKKYLEAKNILEI